MKNKISIIIILIILNLINIWSKEFKIINTILNSIDESEERITQRYKPLVDEIKQVKNILDKKNDISNLNLVIQKEKELNQIYDNFIVSCKNYKKTINRLNKKYFELAFKEAYNNKELKEIEVKLNEAQQKFISLSKAGKVFSDEYHTTSKICSELSDKYNQLNMQLMITKYSSYSSKNKIIDYFKKGDIHIQKEMEFHDFYSEVKILLAKLEYKLKIKEDLNDKKSN